MIIVIIYIKGVFMSSPHSYHHELDHSALDNPLHSAMHDIELCQDLAIAIRQAPQPQRNDVFFAYFELADQISLSLPIVQQWQLYKSQLHLLLSTIEDPRVPAHWRRMCFESVHRPLLSLRRLNKHHSEQSELRDLYLIVNQQLNTAFVQAPF